MILKHSILQLLDEHEALNLSELATRLQTSEEYVRVTIEQMIESGTPVKLRNNVVCNTRKKDYLIAIPVLMFAIIVILPAVSGWN